MAGYPIMNSAKLKKFRLAGIDGFQNYLLANQSETCSVGIFLHSLYKNDVSSLLFFLSLVTDLFPTQTL